MTWKQLFCRHNTVEIVRVHPDSETGRRYGRLVGFKDEKGCIGIARCTRCWRYLTLNQREPLYASIYITNFREEQ